MPYLSQEASEVPFAALAGKKRVRFCDMETGISRRYRENPDYRMSDAVLKVPVPKWTTRAKVIVPGDEATGEVSVQIGSVRIPYSMAARVSVFGQRQSLYVSIRF
ncbi:hypothetical protein F5Y10DRAFT_267950 [Nemania abortiva]|nr:hypothetical protein F5Y10DRAFT_267950 [Nemania abortiva]